MMDQLLTPISEISNPRKIDREFKLNQDINVSIKEKELFSLDRSFETRKIRLEESIQSYIAFSNFINNI